MVKAIFGGALAKDGGRLALKSKLNIEVGV